MTYTEVKEKGFKSLETLVAVMNEVVDKMQEAEVPVTLIRGKLLAEIGTMLDEAHKKQMARWSDV